MKKGINASLPQGWKNVCFGIGTGMLGILTVAASFAFLIEKEILDVAYMNIAASLALLIGSLLGALCSGRGEGRILRVICVGVGQLLLLLLINIIFFGGSLGGLVPGVVVISGGCAAATLIRASGSGRKRSHYRRYRNR